MIAFHFHGRKELNFIHIKYSGPNEDILDIIVRNDDCNTNEEKKSILCERFTKFLRMKKPFFKDFKKR